MTMRKVVVQKLDHERNIVLSWIGELVDASEGRFVVRAVFAPRTADQVIVDGVALRAGDIFTEYYFADRWYNIMHVAGPDGSVRGWYCNVARPAQYDGKILSYVDLALDLFVHPNWRHTVLDADEFDDLAKDQYDSSEVVEARAALDDLVLLAVEHSLPMPSTT
jgi:protein associated with RNAse G/E